MKIYRSLEELQISEPTALTIGKFEALHLGHRELLEQIKKAASIGLKTLVIRLKSETQKDRSLLLTDEEAEKKLEEFGIEYLAELTMDQTFLNLSAESFLKDVLVDKCSMKAIFCGSDFCFGKGRAGDVSLLKANEEAYGYKAYVYQKRAVGEKTVSSTGIKEDILAGEIERAEEALGYAYSFTGEVIHGRHLASWLGFPTANMIPDPKKILPPFGVYAAEVIIDGYMHMGMANLGVKPTITDEKTVLLETNVFDFSGDLYGKTITVFLKQYVRPEQSFPSVDALKKQMGMDSDVVRNFFF